MIKDTDIIKEIKKVYELLLKPPSQLRPNENKDFNLYLKKANEKTINNLKNLGFTITEDSTPYAIKISVDDYLNNLIKRENTRLADLGYPTLKTCILIGLCYLLEKNGIECDIW